MLYHLLGHENIETTMIYEHFNKKQLQRMYNKVKSKEVLTWGAVYRLSEKQAKNIKKRKTLNGLLMRLLMGRVTGFEPVPTVLEFCHPQKFCYE